MWVRYCNGPIFSCQAMDFLPLMIIIISSAGGCSLKGELRFGSIEQVKSNSVTVTIIC